MLRSVETDRGCTDLANVGGVRYAKTRRPVLGGHIASRIAVHHSSNIARCHTIVLAFVAVSPRLLSR